MYGKIFESIYDGTLVEDWRAPLSAVSCVAINNPQKNHINNERGPQHLTGVRPGSIVVSGAFAEDGKQNAEPYRDSKNFLHSLNVAENAANGEHLL